MIFDSRNTDTQHQVNVIRNTQLAASCECSYCSLRDSIPVGVFRTTPSGKIIDANAALAHIHQAEGQFT